MVKLASSRVFLLCGLFLAVLVVMAAQISARELADETQSQKSVKEASDGCGRACGKVHGGHSHGGGGHSGHPPEETEDVSTSNGHGSHGHGGHGGHPPEETEDVSTSNGHGGHGHGGHGHGGHPP